MSVYENAGVLLLRIVAILMLLIGAAGLVLVFCQVLLRVRFSANPSEFLFAGVAWMLMGAVLYLIARPVARFAAKGLD